MESHHFTKWVAGQGHVFDADAARACFCENRHYVVDHVVRWSSNDSVPPADLLQDWFEANCISRTDLEESKAARDADLTKFAREYRRRARPLSGEALMEARANFEPGTVLVDVFSGARTRL